MKIVLARGWAVIAATLLIAGTLLAAATLFHATPTPNASARADFDDVPPLSNGETIESMFEHGAWIRIWVGVDARYAKFNAAMHTMSSDALAAQKARMRDVVTELIRPVVEGGVASIPPRDPSKEGGLPLDELTVVGPNGLLSVNRDGLRVLMSSPIVASISFDGHSQAIWTPSESRRRAQPATVD